jgi:alpha-D-xyloside xylohydrolase
MVCVLLLIAACGDSFKIASAKLDRCTVTTDGGHATVTRMPFSVQLFDREGTAVPGTLERNDRGGGTAYAPLGLVTGDDPELRYPVLSGLGGQPDPNPTDPVTPRYFPVTSVADLDCTGNTLTALLHTDNPQLSLQLTIVADAGNALAINLNATPTSDVSGVFASFASDSDESFHGFGGRRESTNLRGLAFQNWVLDYRFPDLTTGYYYSQPQFISSAGYGLLLDTDALASWRLASDFDDAWRVIAAGSRLKIVLAPGDAAVAIERITRITGRHRVAPSWSMGPTLSRTIQILPGAETPQSYRNKVEDDLANIEARALPIEAYAFEGWAVLDREFVKTTIAGLRARGIHAILYIRSFVADDSDTTLTEPPERFTEAVDNGYTSKTQTGDAYFYPNSFNARDAAVIDFTNPAAQAWWKELVVEMLELGADGFMSDFGEQVIADMVFADGSTGALMHNRYPRLQHQLTREAVDDFMLQNPGREIYFFTRAGYSGRPGAAAYENAVFPGDEAVDWSKSNGLASIVPDMLNRAIGGAYGFSTDIGGYADWTGSGGTSKELYIRWTQAAVFTTHFRVHGSALTGVRMPWSFAADDTPPRVLDVWKAAADLHLRARPLMLQLWREAVDTGIPITRPLWLHDPASRHSPHVDDQWLVGPNVLVAPVLEEGARQREVWLPEGCWQLHGIGQRYTGHTLLNVAAPLTVLPWFTRCATAPLLSVID